MAEGELSRSVVGSSDILYDFMCTPCSEDGGNNEAVNFCITCQRNFCQTCVKLHNKVLRSHTLLDKDGMNSAKLKQQEKNATTLLPSDCCEEHTGNILQMYCSQHDTVCCTVCIAVDHRLCSGIDFIPKIAKGILKGPERYGINTSLSETQKELEEVKVEKKKSISACLRERDCKLEDIHTANKRLIARLEELEQVSTQEVRTRYKHITDEMDMEIASLDETLKKVECQIDNITQFKGDNEAQFFVHMKNGEKLELSSKALLGEVRRNRHKNMSFEFNSHFEHLEELLYDVDSFGELIEVGDRKCSLSADYNVKIKSDKETCNIGDICLLENGEYVITDYDNQKLKRLDKTWQVIDTFDIKRPFGVCNTGCMEVAVTSYQDMNIRTISVGAIMTQVRSFDTGIPCKGISYSRNQLFVSCGILGQPGEIRIYNAKGVYVRGFRNDPTGSPLFTWINHLCFDSDALNLYVADQDNGIIVLDRKGSKNSTIIKSRLKFTHGLCTGVCGNLFVSGVDSHNVLQLDKHGVVLQEMMVETGGKSDRPAAVRLFKKQKCLVVTCVSSDIIKVYNIT